MLVSTSGMITPGLKFEDFTIDKKKTVKEKNGAENEIVISSKKFKIYKMPTMQAFKVFGPITMDRERLIDAVQPICEFVTVIVGENEIALDTEDAINSHVDSARDLSDILEKSFEVNLGF